MPVMEPVTDPSTDLVSVFYPLQIVPYLPSTL